MTQSIATAVVLKNDELFFICLPSGEVPMAGPHGFGLYFHDCRYLNGYTLRLGDSLLEVLGNTAGEGFTARFQLTNADVSIDDRLLEKETLGVAWERTIDADQRCLHDVIRFTNFGTTTRKLPVSIALRSGFESVFEVRGAEPEQRGTLHAPAWHGRTLAFRYDGADHVQRSLLAEFTPAPDRTNGASASFDIDVAAGHETCISAVLRVRESSDGPREHSDDRSGSHGEDVAPGRDARRDASPSDASHARHRSRRASDDWVERATRVETNDRLFNEVFDRCLRDLHLLRTTLHGRRYFAAGVPWYVTLFGRDSLVTALETLAIVPGVADDTLRLLADFQGRKHDPWRDEEPGKIMHELRAGEMARLNEIPQTPYYGTIDATPLFLMLLARHASWTGRLDLVDGLQPHIEAALGWIDRTMADGSGFLSYMTGSSKGLANQGWKDSGDAISNRDGTLATPPIALIEVQGYVYFAKKALAAVYRHAHHTDQASRLERDAEVLRTRVNDRFWSEDLGTYVIALQRDGRPAETVSSNAGQVLWSGLATSERAKRTTQRLFEPDMFSGWGIRTLSSRESRYNPIGYHTGTIWPHDNAIIAAGLRRYGFGAEAARLLTSLVEAAAHFAHHRLPEVFGGFDRDEYPVPIRYPVACHPQAWAAGSVPFMLESALGLEPDAWARRLIIRQPCLPPFVHTLTMDRLSVGDAMVRLEFRRTGDRVTVADVKVRGRLDVQVAE